MAVHGFSEFGLVQFHAIFASYPLMVVTLSVPFWAKSLAGGDGWLLAADLQESWLSCSPAHQLLIATPLFRCVRRF